MGEAKGGCGWLLCWGLQPNLRCSRQEQAVLVCSPQLPRRRNKLQGLFPPWQEVAVTPALGGSVGSKP